MVVVAAAAAAAVVVVVVVVVVCSLCYKIRRLSICHIVYALEIDTNKSTFQYAMKYSNDKIRRGL